MSAAPESTDQLRFRCRGRDCTLLRGATLSADVAGVYRDIAEDVLCGIIKRIEAGAPWREVVADCFAEKHPWLHQIVTAPNRDLFLRQQPPPPQSRILDIGAGWGQIALPLARDGYVCALEPTPERLAFIRVVARQEGLDHRMWFVQANASDVEFTGTFDLVTCIGVLEWVPKFSPHRDPFEAQREFLTTIRDALAPEGKLVIGIENRLGLKYLLGAPDDHLGHAGIAVYDHGLATQKWRAATGEPLRSLTHTRAELDSLLAETGFSRRAFYCAFPDYKIPETILPWGEPTNAFLASSFVTEHEGITGSVLPFQSELRSHYRSLARLGIAADFAPSFFVVAEVAGEREQSQVSQSPSSTESFH